MSAVVEAASSAVQAPRVELGCYRCAVQVEVCVVVQLRGVQSNAEGRGATIRALVDGTWQTRWPGAVDPVLTGRPAVVSFGLGTAAQIETLEL